MFEKFVMRKISLLVVVICGLFGLFSCQNKNIPIELRGVWLTKRKLLLPRSKESVRLCPDYPGILLNDNDHLMLYVFLKAIQYNRRLDCKSEY